MPKRLLQAAAEVASLEIAPEVLVETMTFAHANEAEQWSPLRAPDGLRYGPFAWNELLRRGKGNRRIATLVWRYHASPCGAAQMSVARDFSYVSLAYLEHSRVNCPLKGKMAMIALRTMRIAQSLVSRQAGRDREPLILIENPVPGAIDHYKEVARQMNYLGPMAVELVNGMPILKLS